ncbi:MAG: GNAT family N-acetyltransferase [Verrucomicrobiota bacterium]
MNSSFAVLGSVGVAAIRRAMWFMRHYREFLYIDRIIIASEARRHGVATKLYDELQHFARIEEVTFIT